MKITLLFVLSILLVTNSLTPLVLALCSQDFKTGMAIDFNKEENKKEEKKEINEKDFFSTPQLIEFTSIYINNSSIPTFYLEGGSTFLTDIFLPPPEPSIFNMV